MIDERETGREARLLIQMMQVSIKIPHDMSYWKGTAKFWVIDLLHLGRAKRQVNLNL